jgi:hypothetical protein
MRLNVNNKILGVLVAALAVLLILTGCSRSSSSSGSSSTSGEYKIVRKAALGSSWQMYEFQLTLPVNGSFDIDLLDLKDNEKVDGYFYTEKGINAALEISAGANFIYQSVSTASGETSDRFAFNATQPLGTAYILNFKNVGTDKEITVFVELIYPDTARLRGPLDLK